MNLGVSVVICCHNSENKIRAVLEHLQNQIVKAPWEVILVDNASRDHTAVTAAEVWRRRPITQLRILTESRLGLVHARKAALREASYSFIAFLDDDNWPMPDWVQTVFELFASDPEIGVVGGLNLASLAGTAPEWFPRYLQRYEAKFTNCFAIGPQAASEGDVSATRGHVWGAGLCIRKEAWDELTARNFPALCTGIKGRRFSRGEDTEVCLALRILGWKIWYSPKLVLTHRLEMTRVQWAHVRRLSRWGGVAGFFHQPYRMVWREYSTQTPVRVPSWYRRIKLQIQEICRFEGATFRDFLAGEPGNPRVLELESKLGHLLATLRFGPRLAAWVAQLRVSFLEQA